ncbi:PRC-barrel domain-containing protein [Phenylobacterium immobile]|uniref:PRC-barrel domain-containing protein n=1 Tax=Phenylobacterium immobile TaxID=21 RepID=UPI00159EDA2C|nr:PRC-barrel domain-containing protein [Phenylobacterium immobile]
MLSANGMTGAGLYNRQREKVGTIEDVAFDQLSGRVAYVVMSHGGFLGFGQALNTLPWELIAYDASRQTYVIPDEWRDQSEPLQVEGMANWPLTPRPVGPGVPAPYGFY